MVVRYYIHNFGHGWPSTAPLENDYQRSGPTYLNATPLIMDFFRKHILLPGGGTEHFMTKDEL
jgi:poly(3-hydroxybutyrate) depolymerase